MFLLKNSNFIIRKNKNKPVQKFDIKEGDIPPNSLLAFTTNKQDTRVNIRVMTCYNVSNVIGNAFFVICG